MEKKTFYFLCFSAVLTELSALLGKILSYLPRLAALWFITLKVYYTHKPALLIDQEFQSAAVVLLVCSVTG